MDASAGGRAKRPPGDDTVGGETVRSDVAQNDAARSGAAQSNTARSDVDQPGGAADRGWVLTALDEHEGRLTRYALRLTGDVHAARDVVQHVFLQLCDHPPAARNGQLASWLFTVCHNRAMDFRRRSGRDASLELVAPESLAGDSIDPAKLAEADDAVALLRAVIDTLPDAQRVVVNLWSAGFKYAEIAELIGKTESYVRVASHRAWQAIRKHPRVRKLTEETMNAER